MNFEIPEGLTDLLQDFTVEVLRKRPTDLLAFAVQHFEELLDKRSSENSKNMLSKLGATGTTSNAPTAAAASSASASNHHHNHSRNEDADEDEDDEMGDMPELPKNRYAGARRVSVAAEKYNPEEDTSDEPAVVHPKSEQEREYLLKVVAQIFIFRSLEQKQLNRVLDAMFARDVVNGDVIIEQGDDGDNFYIIETGVYDIHVNKNKVGSYDNKGSFGELALMYNMPRAATIIATTKGKLWALDRLTFKRIVLKSAFEKRKMYEGLLENMPMFESLNGYERMNVADALFSREFKDGEAIIKQGEQAKCMYFVETGQVRCVMELDGKSKEIKVYNKGEYFGELALLTKKPRAATLYAVGGDTKCAILDVEAFERLLGPCVKIMQKNIPDYENTLRKMFGENFKLGDIEKK
jgi:cAMP-dependent protein kinase regulator